MTPEITWTSAGPDQVEAWHEGRQWVLLLQNRRPGRAAGWYLHATVDKDVYDEHGRWMARTIVGAEAKATALLLSPEGGEMAEIADREAGITEGDHMAPEFELHDEELLIDEAEAVEFDRHASGVDADYPDDFRDRDDD